MLSVILVFHVMIAIALIGVVLLQQSDGGGLGLGGGGAGQFMTPRGASNLLSRTTAILATIFFLTSLVLVILSGAHSNSTLSVLDQVENADEAPAVPLSGVDAGKPAVEEKPTEPAVPIQ